MGDKFEYHRRRAAGLCVAFGCNNKPLEGRPRCQYHLDRLLAQQRSYLKEKYDRGICFVAGCSNPRFKNHVRCEKHHREHNKYTMNSSRERNCLRMFCKDCSKPPVLGKIHCEDCRNKYNERRRKLRNQRVLGGRCYECNSVLSEYLKLLGRTHCEKCLEKRRRYRRAGYFNARKLGLSKIDE